MIYMISAEDSPHLNFTIDSDEVENLEVEIQTQLNKRGWYRWEVIIYEMKEVQNEIK